MTEEQEVPGGEEMEPAGPEPVEESPAPELPERADDIREVMGDSEITSDDKLWAALGYPIVLLAIIVLFIDKKNRPFVKYHAVQAIAFNLVLWAVYALLSLTVVGALCFPVFWLVSLWPAWKAYQGEYMELPVITNFIKGQGWVA